MRRECEAIGCCFEKGVAIDMVLEGLDGCITFRGRSSGYYQMERLRWDSSLNEFIDQTGTGCETKSAAESNQLSLKNWDLERVLTHLHP